MRVRPCVCSPPCVQRGRRRSAQRYIRGGLPRVLLWVPTGTGALAVGIERKRVNWVLDADIRDFFGRSDWVPEVGGPIDPGSDAHDLVMSLYGGMSKGERNRIKIRVRAAMAAQASTEGRFLGGRPPYGYRLADLGPHPNPGKAATGHRLHGLEPNPATAPVIARIFDEYLGGARACTRSPNISRDGIPSPSAHDRARNPHRCGLAWSKAAIRAIVNNPRYTGHQVWNRQRRDEVLIDVDDVALGHETRMRWNQETEWIWSPEAVHQPLISTETFQAVQAKTRDRQGQDERKARSSPRPYALRRLVSCGLCDRKMEGTWNGGRAHYRCRYPREYALANHIDHPRTVYVREDAILGSLDSWLASAFRPHNLDATLDALMSAQTARPLASTDADDARRILTNSEQRLALPRAPRGWRRPAARRPMDQPSAGRTLRCRAPVAAGTTSARASRQQRRARGAGSRTRRHGDNHQQRPSTRQARPLHRTRPAADLQPPHQESARGGTIIPTVVRNEVSVGGLEPPRA